MKNENWLLRPWTDKQKQRRNATLYLLIYLIKQGNALVLNRITPDAIFGLDHEFHA
jgi:hypothetical protein